MYANWLTGIYDVTDGMFKYHEREDQIRWLEGLIKEKIGPEALWDEDGEYRWKPKDEYEGIKRTETTEGERWSKNVTPSE